MRATEFIAAALEGGRMWMESLLADIDGPDLVVAPTPNGGNHALFALGHIAFSEASLVNNYIRPAAQVIPRGWPGLFGRGCQPVRDASKYPSKAELLEAWRGIRARTLEVLKSLGDADLDRTTAAENKELFGTVGKCFAVMISHQAFHAGQIADVRRALGRRPLFG